MKNYSLSLALLLVAPTALATPTIQNTATKEEKTFFKKGAEKMKTVVEICNKKEFDGDTLDKIINDNRTIVELNEGLEESPLSPIHQKAFKNFQSYLCGMRSVVDTYKSQGYRTQDAVIKTNKKFLDFALSAPDYQTIITYNKKQLEAFNKRLQIARWEILAELP